LAREALSASPELEALKDAKSRMNVATSSTEPTMTQRIRENFSTPKWRLVTIMGDTMPPRDPNDDDDDDDDDEDDTEPDDEREPPVVREPDEDE
jgi:hypothetical protein